MKVPNEKEPQTVIMDGCILDDSLRCSGKSRGWLRTELEKLGLTLENVFIGQVDSYGELTVDIYDDKFEILQQPAATIISNTKKNTG